MARDGTGVYSLPSGNPVQTGSTISSSNYNTTLNDIAAAISQSLSKDGQSVPTANLPMGGFKLTGMAPGAASGDSATFEQIAAAIAIIANSRDGVRGLVGANNATTPLTKYDLAADAVTLRNSSGATVTRYNTGTNTCDLGVSSAANGRDQTPAFSPSSWVQIYFIWNPTTSTLATLASLLQPAFFTGSSLPSGYTHWAYATTVRWNASSNLLLTRARGKSVWYELDNNGAANRLLSAGRATTFTAINLASVVPPIAGFVELLAIIDGVASTAVAVTLLFRPTGSSMSFGVNGASAYSPGAGIPFGAVGRALLPPGNGNQVDYRLSGIPDTSGGAYIDVAGYTVPNGGE